MHDPVPKPTQSVDSSYVFFLFVLQSKGGEKKLNVVFDN